MVALITLGYLNYKSMKPEKSISFSFTRKGNVIKVWFNNHPQKTSEGKEQWLGFTRTCNSDLEAILLFDYMQDFQHLIHKEYFTAGFEAHKKKQKNYYAD